jgi:hypothetical protein
MSNEKDFKPPVKELTPTRAKARRGRKTFVVQVSPTLIVRIRQMDMMTMVMNNLVPLHLLDAATKFEEMEKKMSQAMKDGDAALSVAKEVDPTALADTMKFLKHYAIIVVVEPKIVAEDDGNEDNIPVEDLTAEELMAIFYARAPGEEEEAGPLLNREEADEFRGAAPDAASETGPASETVQSEAEHVAPRKREAIHA